MLAATIISKSGKKRANKEKNQAAMKSFITAQYNIYRLYSFILTDLGFRFRFLTRSSGLFLYIEYLEYRSFSFRDKAIVK
jgi:hypothetical protein